MLAIDTAMSPSISALVDYFRCPENPGEIAVCGNLSAGKGFFKFHSEVCYGRCLGSPTDHLNGNLTDVSVNVGREGNRLYLPFDLAEIVDNLRRERYTSIPQTPSPKITGEAALRSAYYLVRPMLPVSVRKHLQRIRLRGWDQIPFPHWPVDFTVDALMQRTMTLLLQESGTRSIPFIWFWPDGASSCVMMTHDVEGPAGVKFCDMLMDLDDSYGVKSSFQIIPERRHPVRRLLSRLQSRGFEVNVHDLTHDGHLFDDRPGFLKRVKKINDYARQFQSHGFRSGVMYRRQDWFDAFELSYDMSVPNVAHLEPQRGGCCTVMPYFVGNILELPLTTIQDYSLFHILDDYSISLWQQQIDLIRSKNGLISINTHPDYLIERRARATYLRLLTHLRGIRHEGRLWMAQPGEVNRWWRSRRDMVLVRDGDAWRIEGDDSHRARIAHAVLENDRVVYRLDRSL